MVGDLGGVDQVVVEERGCQRMQPLGRVARELTGAFADRREGAGGEGDDHRLPVRAVGPHFFFDDQLATSSRQLVGAERPLAVRHSQR